MKNTKLSFLKIFFVNHFLPFPFNCEKNMVEESKHCNARRFLFSANIQSLSEQTLIHTLTRVQNLRNGHLNLFSSKINGMFFFVFLLKTFCIFVDNIFENYPSRVHHHFLPPSTIPSLRAFSLICFSSSIISNERPTQEKKLCKEKKLLTLIGVSQSHEYS